MLPHPIQQAVKQPAFVVEIVAAAAADAAAGGASLSVTCLVCCARFFSFGVYVLLWISEIEPGSWWFELFR